MTIDMYFDTYVNKCSLIISIFIFQTQAFGHNTKFSKIKFITISFKIEIFYVVFNMACNK